mgnify:CR=1 FL=1
MNITEIPTKLTAKAGIAMLVDASQNMYIEKTGDVVLSWATSPILATDVEPNVYDSAFNIFTCGISFVTISASLICL